MNALSVRVRLSIGISAERSAAIPVVLSFDGMLIYVAPLEETTALRTVAMSLSYSCKMGKNCELRYGEFEEHGRPHKL